MEFNRKFEGDPGCFPRQLYFVGKMDTKLLEAAKEFHLPILEHEHNNNTLMTTPLTQTIYIFRDFGEEEMFFTVEKTPKTWILGPTALDEMCQNPDLELRSKPTYCTFLYSCVFYINCPEDVPLMRHLVKLIKWMGGRFVTSPNCLTTHMITNHSLAKGYLYCTAFGVPIVDPAWVDFCWQHRSLPYFNVTERLEWFRVKAFAGLKIAFECASSDELKKLESKAIANGATVVQPDEYDCTHLVVSDAAKRLIANIPTHIQYVVSEQWLFFSIDQEYRVMEEPYLCFPEKQELIWAMISEKRAHDARKTTSNGLFLNNTRNSEIEKQNEKRKYAFDDLYLKEKNFLCCLKMLCKIRNLATNILDPEGIILNETEAGTIFGNVTEIVKIHQEFFKCFAYTLKNWENDAVTVRPIIMSKDSLLQQYLTYTTNYDDSKQLLEDLEKKNKRFRKLLENFKSVNKEHPKDMLIRPIQRLCSLLLQIQEVSKYTRRDNPDKEVLEVAAETLRDVLQQVNDTGVLHVQANVTRNISNCRMKKYYDSLPVTTYHGDLIIQFSAQEVLAGEGVPGIQVMFFLFNKILEITRTKSKYFQFSKQNLHLATIPLSMIVNVIEFQNESNDEQKVFGLNVKRQFNERTTSLYCFRNSNRDCLQIKNIPMLIANQLVPKDSSKSPKDFIEQSHSIAGLSICRITKYNNNALNLLQVPNNDLETNSNAKLRRSRSCGDLINESKSFNIL